VGDMTFSPVKIYALFLSTNKPMPSHRGTACEDSPNVPAAGWVDRELHGGQARSTTFRTSQHPGIQSQKERGLSVTTLIQPPT
jgi:hypothetical protein